MQRFRLLPLRTAVFLLVGVILARSTLPSRADPRPDILFIAVDDLNHWVRNLGRNLQVKTPHLDALAARGVIFTRAYCAAPACNPSRTAVLSGLRPSTSGVYDNDTAWEPRIARGLTLNEHLHAHGYETVGVGKVYHGGAGRVVDWDEFAKVEGREPKPKGSEGVGGIRFAPLDAGDEVMTDHAIATWAAERLERKRDKPLFLAVGFHKPHLPWNVPRKYFDLYPTNKIDLPPGEDGDLDDLPPEGVKMAKALGDHDAILKSGRWHEAVQGYLAAISFVDEQVGRVLAGLDRSPRRTNTMVVLWGDHGWHLGEKQHWRKFALWEEATRTPLIWVAPGVTRPGGRCLRPVDLLSIYPTLCDLAGLPLPGHLEGVSLRPLLLDPKAAWNRPVLTTHGYRNHAVRSEKWRYIRYAGGGEELYDESKDPFEWTNLASRPESAAIKADLARHFPATDAPPRAEEK